MLPTRSVTILFLLGLMLAVWPATHAISRAEDARPSKSERLTHARVDKALRFLHAQMDRGIDPKDLDSPRFVASYVPNKCRHTAPPRAAYVYDQALVILALLATKVPDNLARADLIARALVWAQDHDRTFADGRLRNAYLSGEPLQDVRTARFPGRWNARLKLFEEDQYAVGSDTGNLAWAALALTIAHDKLPKRDGQPYLTAAIKIADWIRTHTRRDDAFGGFDAGVWGFESAVGYPGGQSLRSYRATEHNIVLSALFRRVARTVGPRTELGRTWFGEAKHARDFVERMRHAAPHAYLQTGTTAAGEINKSVTPVDVQALSALAEVKQRRPAQGLSWAFDNCTAANKPNTFDFNCSDGDGAWYEGTAQVAAALAWVGDGRRDKVVDVLLAAQLRTGSSQGALPAASICGLTTGFLAGATPDYAIRYTNAPHIGATAWFVLALLGDNPFAK